MIDESCFSAASEPIWKTVSDEMAIILVNIVELSWLQSFMHHSRWFHETFNIIDPDQSIQIQNSEKFKFSEF